MSFDRKQLAQFADWEVMAIAVALPWSTSATSILLVVWLITLIPTLNAEMIWREVKSPAGGLPVLLWLLGVIGMLWADANWSERFAGLGSFHRLLAIPLLLAQFRHSANGRWVVAAFLASAVVLLIASWALVLGLISWQTRNAFGRPGVMVHDIIAQSTIVLISAFALFWLVRDSLVQRKWGLAIGAGCLAALFLADLIFVATSRAEMFVAPMLVVLLGWRWWDWTGAGLACAAAAVLATAALMSSPHLQTRLQQVIDDVKIYRTTGAHTDVGDHIEFLKKSLAFFSEAPFVGHGTGSLPDLFRRSTIGQTGAAAVPSVNPHNQILAVGIQLGSLGALVLLAMWFAHFILFSAPTLMGWVGTVVVVENMLSSLTSSHLFDFVHGWLYVLSVGTIGGMMYRASLDKTTRSSSILDSCRDFAPSRNRVWP
jgi:O-antigen ligase